MDAKTLLISLLFLFGASAITVSQAETTAAHPVRTGIEVLEGRGFAPLVGKRVGLVTNPSGVDSNLRSTIDILFNAPGVHLAALYGPEHGVRGDAYAGSEVEDSDDPVTGLRYTRYTEHTASLLLKC